MSGHSRNKESVITVWPPHFLSVSPLIKAHFCSSLKLLHVMIGVTGEREESAETGRREKEWAETTETSRYQSQPLQDQGDQERGVIIRDKLWGTSCSLSLLPIDIQEIVLESKAKIHKHEEVRLRNMCSIQSLFQEKLIYNIINLW